MNKTLTALIAVPALAAGASADTINIFGDMANSTEHLCDFAGTISYSALGGDLGELVISLTNTTAANIGGYITGMVFNIGHAGGDASLLSRTYPFDVLDNPSGAPFGHFDTGAALGGSWLGGGSPHDGIPVGQTGLFVFEITSPGASSLSAADFMDGPNQFNFVVRFRGLANGGSDKVPGRHDVPTPGAAGLLGMGALAAARRRRTA